MPFCWLVASRLYEGHCPVAAGGWSLLLTCPCVRQARDVRLGSAGRCLVLVLGVGSCWGLLCPCHRGERCWGRGVSLGSMSGATGVPGGRMCAQRQELCPVAMWQHRLHGAGCWSWLLPLQHLSSSSPPLPPWATVLVPLSSSASGICERVSQLELCPLFRMKLMSFSSVAKDCSCCSVHFTESLGFACLLPFSLPAPGS